MTLTKIKKLIEKEKQKQTGKKAIDIINQVIFDNNLSNSLTENQKQNLLNNLSKEMI